MPRPLQIPTSQQLATETLSTWLPLFPEFAGGHFDSSRDFSREEMAVALEEFLTVAGVVSENRSSHASSKPR